MNHEKNADMNNSRCLDAEDSDEDFGVDILEKAESGPMKFFHECQDRLDLIEI
jgi:hypothetical protein